MVPEMQCDLIADRRPMARGEPSLIPDGSRGEDDLVAHPTSLTDRLESPPESYGAEWMGASLARA